MSPHEEEEMASPQIPLTEPLNPSDAEHDKLQPQHNEKEKETEEEEEEVQLVTPKDTELLYGLEDNPPWMLSLLCGFQQYLAMVGGTIIKPIIISSLICMAHDDPARGTLVSSIVFISGIITLMQSIFGVRLPIVQGANFAYMAPIMSLLSTTFQPCSDLPLANLTAEARKEVWQERIRLIQGSIAMSSLIQILLGFTGVIGLLLPYITPLTIVPTVTLVGLSLFDLSAQQGSQHWGVTFLTIGLTVVLSQHMRNVTIPCPWYGKDRGLYTIPCQPFKTLSLLVAVLIAWLICWVLTVFEVLPPGSLARTDYTGSLISNSPWFYVPYPGQFGLPTLSVVGTLGFLSCVFSSIIESIGDYYTCAKVVGVKRPPHHAMNRGIGVEGVGCLLAGLVGSSSGTTSYSGNIGILSITKVGSRRMIQYSGLIMVACGVLAKIGAVFVTIPGPIIAGIFYIKFSMITSVGLSTLEYVSLRSPRNLFILGISIFFGLSLPKWLLNNPGGMTTGKPSVDNLILVLLQTPMMVGGLVGLILDNTVPGTDGERGVVEWRQQVESRDLVHPQDLKERHSSLLSSSSFLYPSSPYDLPFGMKSVRRARWMRYVPFCPTFRGFGWQRSSCSPCKHQREQQDLQCRI